MAFSNVRNVPLGGGLAFIVADFTHTVGGSDQTIAIAAGRVLMTHVSPKSSGEPVDFSSGICTVSVSGAINTVTIRAEAGISAGTFVALVDNGG